MEIGLGDLHRLEEEDDTLEGLLQLWRGDGVVELAGDDLQQQGRPSLAPSSSPSPPFSSSSPLLSLLLPSLFLLNVNEWGWER
jgi:hypothetical protein